MEGVGIAIRVGNDRQSGRGRIPGKVRLPTSLEHAHRNVAGQSKQYSDTEGERDLS